MNNPIISIKNISKKYFLGERQQYYSFRDTISNIFKFSLKRKNLKKNEFWALKNISFDVNEGEIVGVIGRNGAGKSTLLKILSQITPPSDGEIVLRGRISSLLEVGTGFHSELTGRENIYLNGAILGMKRSEIKSKFDDIVKFSETEKFIDTPVKHYSSGMYMRLAFAVAAHLDSEILIVDEVLAVGDSEFQKKCLGKMSEISRGGRTVLFVSHNIPAVQQLCSRCILLESGELIESGKTRDIINLYLKKSLEISKIPLSKRKDRSGNGAVTIRKVNTGNIGDKSGIWHSGDDVYIDINIKNRSKIPHKNIEIALEFQKMDNTPLLYLGTKITKTVLKLNPGENKSWRCEIPKLPLEPGNYNLIAEIIVEKELSDLISNVTQIEVHPGRYYESGIIWPRSGVLCQYNWISPSDKYI